MGIITDIKIKNSLDYISICGDGCKHFLEDEIITLKELLYAEKTKFKKSKEEIDKLIEELSFDVLYASFSGVNNKNYPKDLETFFKINTNEEINKYNHNNFRHEYKNNIVTFGSKEKIEFTDHDKKIINDIKECALSYGYNDYPITFQTSHPNFKVELQYWKMILSLDSPIIEEYLRKYFYLTYNYEEEPSSHDKIIDTSIGKFSLQTNIIGTKRLLTKPIPKEYKSEIEETEPIIRILDHLEIEKDKIPEHINKNVKKLIRKP